MKRLDLGKDAQLPREVYYQCIWTVRDLPRLRELRAQARDGEGFGEDEIVMYVDDSNRVIPQSVVLEARRKIECIERALSDVPEEYREMILANIVEGRAFGDQAHDNTWKKWKKRFINNLAREMDLF